MDKREASRKFAWMRRTAKNMAARYGRIGINDSEDIAQNVMICVLRNPNSLELGTRWISKAVKNNVIDALRRFTKERDNTFVPPKADHDLKVSEPLDFEQYCSASTSQTPDLRLDLAHALASMQKPLMMTLWLYSQGYSCVEIAAITNTNRSTVRTRLFYGRKTAQKLLIEADLA